MRVLGLSLYDQDSAAALVEDGRIVAAAQEERFTRRKQQPGFPAQAAAWCLAQAGTALAGIDLVALHGHGPIDPALAEATKVVAIDPQLSHAASAYYPSPFDEAVVLTVDGDGGSVAIGRGEQLAMVRPLPPAQAPGRLYSAITGFLGFKVNSGEYKVMGLAPYGRPRFAAPILDQLSDIPPDGASLAALFGGPPRQAEEPLTQQHMDIAASIQAVTEEVMLRLTRALAGEFAIDNLCLAGDVALNCVANGKIWRDGAFKRLWVQPAAGDAGGALGAALAACAPHRGPPGDAMQGAFLGPAFAQPEIEARLAAVGARFRVLSDAAMIEAAAAALAEGKTLGWFQGRMEFGPRALGARSILGDPRVPAMQAQLNTAVKYRETFRPFAPSVLAEDAAAWFDLDGASPYMLLVAPVAKAARAMIPAVTHVDGSARIHTVEAAANPRFHALIARFKALTGCPMLVNTSFNVRGEPMVGAPEDAFRCFMGSDMDRLAVDNCFLIKSEQDASLRHDARGAFEPD